MNDLLHLGGKEFTSRLILGSGKFSLDLITAVIEEGGGEIITLALRRANPDGAEDILSHIPEGVTLLPNTSGARNAEEAVRIAELSRAMGCGNWVKVEVINDSRWLLPDNAETVRATKMLAERGFVVLPYMFPDLDTAKALVDAGAAAVMPLAAPIGTNKGLVTRDLLAIIIEQSNVPVIVDAGLGAPSHAAAAMEMGADAVLVNTAIAVAGDPVRMPAPSPRPSLPGAKPTKPDSEHRHSAPKRRALSPHFSTNSAALCFQKN